MPKNNKKTQNKEFDFPIKQLASNGKRNISDHIFKNQTNLKEISLSIKLESG